MRAFDQHAHHQITVFQRRKAHPQRQVQPFGDHVDPPVGGLQLHLHPRVLEHKAAEQIGNSVVQQGRRATQAYHALRL
ncbi:MAG: hypothetical protein A2Y50_10900 [Pseudomonadales bacterium RIFCSPLOWO2_12_59_9]|nr:MAG: hypothetical protein A2Y50_10900 [Pseudomonadales bacterium RIFCSPLOWO2_12_59_9]